MIMQNRVSFRLNIESPLVRETAANFRLPSWPPPRDFPVTIDLDGTVISRYGDAVWDLSCWDRVPKVVNFGDGPLRKGAARISGQNAETFRMVAAWWLWGRSPINSASTFVSQHQLFRNLFALCTREGLDARELSKYPIVIEKLASVLPNARGAMALVALHLLYEHRDDLGFIILDAEGIRRLASRLPCAKDSSQTPYIPPRIWIYQVGRLREVLDEFNSHRQQIELCYQKVLDAYARSYGSIRRARDSVDRRPSCGGRGIFQSIARECEIDGILLRWATSVESQPKRVSMHVFASYLTLVNRVGLAYLLNFSLMRIQEAWSLGIGCLHFENDAKLGTVALLKGETTKNVHDDDAYWITSPSVKAAVDALEAIASWRLKVKESYGLVPLDSHSKLIQSACEPWARNSIRNGRKGIENYPAYQELISKFPQLFDHSTLLITQDDWNLAKLITPTIDETKYGVGKVWGFTWHQLRRTGAVNMQASGLVSSFSLQYQLKHSILATSLYYGQGYSRLPLNRAARAEYIRAMYEVMGRELSLLFSDRFVSPYGVKRKQTILRIVSENDHLKLVAAAKAGQISWRPTLLGVCTKSGPCEYGGIDNIVRCGGGDLKAPCMDALFDHSRLPVIEQLGVAIAERLKNAEPASPQQESLEAQQRSVENVLNVLKNC